MQSSLAEGLVEAVENHFYAVGAHAGVEVEGVFGGRTDPLSHLFVVCQTSAQTNQPEFLNSLSVFSLNFTQLAADITHAADHNFERGVTFSQQMQIIDYDQTDFAESFTALPAAS